MKSITNHNHIHVCAAALGHSTDNMGEIVAIGIGIELCEMTSTTKTFTSTSTVVSLTKRFASTIAQEWTTRKLFNIYDNSFAITSARLRL